MEMMVGDARRDLREDVLETMKRVLHEREAICGRGAMEYSNFVNLVRVQFEGASLFSGGGLQSVRPLVEELASSGPFRRTSDGHICVDPD